MMSDQPCRAGEPPAPLMMKASPLDGESLGQVTFLHVRGTLDASNADDFSHALASHLARAEATETHAVLDMTDVYLSSAAAVRALDQVTRGLAAAGRPLPIVQPRPHVREALRLAGLPGIRPHATVESALRGLRSAPHAGPVTPEAGPPQPCGGRGSAGRSTRAASQVAQFGADRRGSGDPRGAVRAAGGGRRLRPAQRRLPALQCAGPGARLRGGDHSPAGPGVRLVGPSTGAHGAVPETRRRLTGGAAPGTGRRGRRGAGGDRGPFRGPAVRGGGAGHAGAGGAVQPRRGLRRRVRRGVAPVGAVHGRPHDPAPGGGGERGHRPGLRLTRGCARCCSPRGPAPCTARR